MLEIRKLGMADADSVEIFAKWTLKSVSEAFFSALDRPLIEKTLNNKMTFSYGMFDGNILVAISLAHAPGIGSNNYGYDLGYSDAEMSQVGQLIATIVNPTYRQGGIGSQLIFKNCEAIFEANYPIILSTVHPENLGSIKMLMKNGFVVKKQLLKYGGFPRLIVEKRKLDGINP
jgi:ribosomal protein S18 acetylase RimI-like enzyme